MATVLPYPLEIRERAIRLYHEAREAEPDQSMNAVYQRIGKLLSIHPSTLRVWVNQAAIDSGTKPGTTTEDKKKIRELEREVKELKRANEILLAASSFFARELDPRLPW